MALSGTSNYKYFAGSHHAVFFSWSATQSQDTLTSTVTINVKYWVQAGWNIYKGSSASACTINVNGTTYNLSAYIGDIGRNDNSDQIKTIATKTVTVKHDSESGAANLSISVSVGVDAQLSGTWYYTQTCPSQSWSLNTIEVITKPVVTVSAAPDGFGRIKINWSVKSKYAPHHVKFVHTVTGSGSWFPYSQSFPIESGVTSGSYVFENLEHATKYTVRAVVYCLQGATDTGEYEFSYNSTTATTLGMSAIAVNTQTTTIDSFTAHPVSFTFDNINRAYLRIASILVNDEITVPFNKNAGNGYGENVNVNLAEAQIRGILAAIPSGKTCSIKFVYQCYTSSAYDNLIGEAATDYMSVTFSNTNNQFNPIINASAMYSVLDNKTSQMLADNGYSNRTDIVIADFSTINIYLPMSAITCVEGSEPTKFNTKISKPSNPDATVGATLNTYKNTDLLYAVVARPKINGDLRLTFRVTDSRGFYTDVTYDFLSLQYTNPTIDASVARDADVTSAVHLADLQVKWSDIYGGNTLSNGQPEIIIRNTVTIKYGYKAGSDSAELTDATTVLTGYPVTVTADSFGHSVKWSKANIATDVPLSKTTFAFVIEDILGRAIGTTCQVRNSIPILRMLQNGQVSVNCGVVPGAIFSTGGSIAPSANSSFDLGTADNRWKNIYLNNSPSVTSDMRLKEEITPIGEELEAAFFGMEPISYKYKNYGDSNHDRTHMGFIAQRVDEVLTEAGHPIDEFALVGSDKVYSDVCKEDTNWINPYEKAGIDPEDRVYSMAYMEMIPLNTHMIQKLYDIITQQQKQINELTALVSKLARN